MGLFGKHGACQALLTDKFYDVESTNEASCSALGCVCAPARREENTAQHTETDTPASKSSHVFVDERRGLDLLAFSFLRGWDRDLRLGTKSLASHVTKRVDCQRIDAFELGDMGSRHCKEHHRGGLWMRHLVHYPIVGASRWRVP